MADTSSVQPDVVVDGEGGAAAAPAIVTPDANPAATPSDASIEGGAPSAEDANQPKSMLEAVEAAIKPASEGDSSKPKVQEKTEAEKAADAADPAKPKEAEEDQPPPFHEHPAWQRQIAKVKERDEKIAALSPKAEQFDKIVEFAERSNLSDKELDAGFNIMALMRRDPAKALEALRPYVSALQKAVGEVLPDDLRADVEKGNISEPHAKELAKARASQAGSKVSAAERAKQESTRLAADMKTAVQTWEGQWASSDPDYEKKAKLTRDRLVAKISADGMPETVADMVALAKVAKAEIDKEVGGFMPRPAAIKSEPNPGAARVTTTAPKTMLEALEAGLQAA